MADKKQKLVKGKNAVELPPKEVVAKSYNPQGKELEVQEFLTERINVMKNARKQNLIGLNAGTANYSGSNNSIEQIWRDADREYTPHTLNYGTGRRRLESNEDTGLRSRLVDIGGESAWQSDNASPDLYVKVNTAFSILIDQNPEAVFIADSKKYEKNTKLAYANWKHSWEVGSSKQQLKMFVFNLAKYGTAYGRTYPKKVTLEKNILQEYYSDKPEDNKYEKKTITKFNGLCRENLNPQQVWISEQARLGDELSIDDWYFEKDYSWDKFQQEFKEYSNIEYVSKGSKINNDTTESDNQKNVDNVTVGFYENQVLDLQVIIIPSSNVILCQKPLDNDKGKLSLWTANWSIRDDRSSYGIGLYEIIKNDSVLYDRLSNMTIDQITLSIYKMFFYQGTDMLGENGVLKIAPGVGHQVIDPKSIQWLDTPGPGADAWQGLQYLQDKRDSNSGITPQLSAKFAGKTLGQDLQAKESALERLKTPLDFICDALQVEGYLSLSWLNQILSTPEILEYTTEEDLAAVLKENGMADEDIQKYIQENENPSEDSKLLFNEENTPGEVPESQTTPQQPPQIGPDGQPMMPMPPMPVPANKTRANVYPEVRVNLNKNKEGELIESKDSRFYRIGLDIQTEQLDWKGIIRIKPQSILAPSKELLRRSKLDLFNLVIPAIEKMLQMPQFIPILLPPIEQVVKAYDEDSGDWIVKDELDKLYQDSQQPPPPPPEEKPKINLSIKFETLAPEIQKQILTQDFNVKVETQLFVDANNNGIPDNQEGGSPPSNTPNTPSAPPAPPGLKPLVPSTQLSGGSQSQQGTQSQLNNFNR